MFAVIVNTKDEMQFGYDFGTNFVGGVANKIVNVLTL